MNESKDRLKFYSSLFVASALWGVSLVWYLACKRNGSAYNVLFLAFSSPGIPGGILGYWTFRVFGNMQGSRILYHACELGIPSVTMILSWTTVIFQCLKALDRKPDDAEVFGARRLIWALIPFLIGWCTIPFVIGKLG